MGERRKLTLVMVDNVLEGEVRASNPNAAKERRGAIDSGLLAGI